MVTVDLVELHDIGNPVLLASKLHGWNPDVPLPVPVEDFARAVGITEIVSKETDGFEGLLLTNDVKSTGTIVVRAASSKERRRFTVSHEVGHFLIPTHTGRVQCTTANLLAADAGGAKSREAQANAFAAELLMPRARFGAELDRADGMVIPHVAALAARYSVSLEAALNRSIDLTAHQCAVVYSRDGVVRYCRKTPRFPWLAVQRGEALPRGCTSARHRGDLRAASEPDAVDVNVWMDDPPRRIGEYILEQTMFQGGGFQVTLLVADAEDDEDED